jgi:hypothetical protein
MGAYTAEYRLATKKEIPAIYNHMDEPGGHYTK